MAEYKMADKYVKLDDVIEILENKWSYYGIRDDLYNLQIAYVAPIEHGKWQYTSAYQNMLRCSECHAQIAYFGGLFRYYMPIKFCANCGAKMDFGIENFKKEIANDR